MGAVLARHRFLLLARRARFRAFFSALVRDAFLPWHWPLPVWMLLEAYGSGNDMIGATAAASAMAVWNFMDRL
jgi:hypothetical protein